MFARTLIIMSYILGAIATYESIDDYYPDIGDTNHIVNSIFWPYVVVKTTYDDAERSK